MLIWQSQFYTAQIETKYTLVIILRAPENVVFVKHSASGKILV